MIWVKAVLLSVMVWLLWQWAVSLNGRLVVIFVTAALLWMASLPVVRDSGMMPNALQSVMGRLIHYLGCTSFALFLVHFPVSMLINAAQDRFDWRLPQDGMMAMASAWFLSMVLADIFYRYVERYGLTLSRRIR